MKPFSVIGASLLSVQDQPVIQSQAAHCIGQGAHLALAGGRLRWLTWIVFTHIENFCGNLFTVNEDFWFAHRLTLRPSGRRFFESSNSGHPRVPQPVAYLVINIGNGVQLQVMRETPRRRLDDRLPAR